MSDHSHDQGHATIAESHAHAAPGNSHRFEQQELTFFEAEDRNCGRSLGFLLAAMFCVLLGLMVSVTIWTAKYHSTGDDPYEGTALNQPGHH